MKIRKGKSEDIPEIYAIEKESTNHHRKIIPKKYYKFDEHAILSPSKNSFIKNFRENMKDKDSFFLVAEEGEKILGYLSVDLFYAGHPKRLIKCTHVMELGVLKKYSGRGIATKLVKYLEKVCKDKKYKFISLNVKLKNIPAIKLYEKNGFEVYDMQLVKGLK